MDTNFTGNVDPYVNTDRSDEGSFERASWKIMIQRFYTDVGNLFEREGQLIKTEIGEKSVQLKEATVSAVSAGVMLFVGALCLAATAIILLDRVMPLWMASVIVTAVFMITGVILLGAAKKKLDADNLVPRKSIDALSEISYTLKEKVNEITKH